MDQHRSQFPVTNRFAYLDHASMGPISTPVLGARRRFLEAHAMLGSEAGPAFRDARERLRASMAAFIGADVDRLLDALP